MQQINSARRTRPDWVLVFSVLSLAAIGLSVIFSLSNVLAEVNAYGQLLFVGIGFLAMIGLWRTDYGLFRRYSKILYGLSILLLCYVLVTDPIQGSSRWIELGFFQFQPSEITKLAVIMVLADTFSSRSARSLKTILVSIIYSGIPFVLVLLQPDLGTALSIGAIWLVMLSMTNVNKLFIVGLFAAALVLSPIVYQFLQPYQQQRIISFIQPSADTAGSNYNVIQANIAAGSGGLSGVGLGEGTQSQLKFLPAQHTDFVFSVIGEKLGFIGAFLTLALLLIVILRVIHIGSTSIDTFGMQVAVGIATVTIVHSIVNIGMNLGLLPVTGIPLPFISYGGTHIIMSFTFAGILLSIDRNNKLRSSLSL